MNKINKLCIFTIITVSILQFAVASFATITQNPIIQHQEEKHLVYENNQQTLDKMLILNDKPVYRLSSQNELNTNYITNNLVEFENEEIINAIKFGYPNFTKEYLNCNTDFEAYTATQEVIYKIYDNRDINKYVAKDETGERIYNAMQQILQNAKLGTFQEELNVQFDEINKELIEEDDRYMQKEYKITLNRPIMLGIISVQAGEGIKLSKTEIHGEENFKILIPKSRLAQNINIKLTTYTENFNMKLATNTNIVDSEQIHLQPHYSKQEHNLNLKTGEFSTIKITNISKHSKTPIQGNKFELLNSELIALKSNLVTDEKGQITIENIQKGKYYLKQVETIEKYCINKTNLLIEITGEESIINVKIVSDSEQNEKVETLEKEINLNEENKNIEEINNKEVININTNNTYKDITNETTVKSKYTNNLFTNTNNLKRNIETYLDNIYNNLIEDETGNTSGTPNIQNKKMTKEDFINLMQLITTNTGLERLPEAGI